MIIFLYGQDSYRSHQKLKEIIERYKKIHPSGLNLKYLDLKQSDIHELKNIFQIGSMFKEKKLIILTNAFDSIGFKEAFVEEGRSLEKSEDVIILYEDNTVDKRGILYKFLTKNFQSQEFIYLEGAKLMKWLEDEFGKYQAEPEPGVEDMIIRFVGSDLWQMAEEVKKLVNFRKGQRVTMNDVRLLVRPKIATDIFATIDALSSRDKKKTFSLIHQHLKKGDSVLYLLAMITYQLRNLLIVKNLIVQEKSYSSIQKESGLHPFVVRKSYQQAQKFTQDELKNVYQKVFQVDVDIKTGRLEPAVALDLFVAGI